MHNQIDIWRRFIGLTKKTEKYPSPFRDAEYTWHLIEPKISKAYLKEKKNDITPDVVSSNYNHWIVTDITLDPKKKWDELVSLQNLPSNVLFDLASPKFSSSLNNPCLLVIGSNNSITKEKCKSNEISGLSLIPNLQFYYQSKTFKDNNLANEFQKNKGEDLKNPPTSLLAIPESKGIELKRALRTILFKYALQEGHFTSNEIMEDLLLNEIKLFSISSRKKLADKVRKELIRLSTMLKKTNDGEWLSYNQKRDYFSIRKDISQPNSFKKFDKLLDKWINSNTTQDTLNI